MEINVAYRDYAIQPGQAADSKPQTLQARTGRARVCSGQNLLNEIWRNNPV